MLSVDYRDVDRRAVLSWAAPDESAPWFDVIKRLILDSTEDAKQEAALTISLPWWNFIASRNRFGEICAGYRLLPGSTLGISPKAADLLRQSRRATDGYQLAMQARAIAEQQLRAKLQELGFARNLTEKQARNVSRIAALPAGATFSVPGAGKTTEALATFFYRANDDERLLVIAPKNAFAAWDEQIKDCMPHLQTQFTRLRGGKERIAKLLGDDPRWLLITYQQLARVSDLVAAHVAQRKTHVFLDESHRIKSGVGRQTARAALGLAHLPVGKLIMSGTPMPQDAEDLIPQFAFLYPEIPSNRDTVIELIKPVYVRTNKTELGLPPVDRVMVPLPMAPMQSELYKLMKFEVSREAATALNTRSKQAFRSLGRSVARLLQFVSNPALLSSEISFAHPDLLAGVLAEGDGP
ncbi:SNF2-related protein, partial [Hydrogenophaga sp. 70-12]|uniref:SNF2-related protein n=1 Tax=Hydrogenophaga sp. 70-12 TaxID=1895769 RepID=UPI000B0D3B66